MTAKAGDVPLICDSPGRKMIVIKSPVALTPEQCARIRQAWDHAVASGSPIVLDKDWVIVEIGGAPYEWPDAEFCAA